MLAAFRWNCSCSSYIALVVGAFLIYNTIFRFRWCGAAEIGIVRALARIAAMCWPRFLAKRLALASLARWWVCRRGALWRAGR
jgi:hypothetical protein